MKHLKTLLLLPILLFSAHTFCLTPEKTADTNNMDKTSEIDDTDNDLGPMKAGELGIMIAASDTTDFIKEWLDSPPDQKVTIKKVRWIKPGEVLYTAFLVTGLYYGVNNSFNYQVSFYVIGPDGEVPFGQRNYAGGTGNHPNKPTIYMADPALELTFNPEDPQGIYVIVAKVEDQTNGKTAKNQYEIYVSEEEPQGPVDWKSIVKKTKNNAINSPSQSK